MGTSKAAVQAQNGANAVLLWHRGAAGKGLQARLGCRQGCRIRLEMQARLQ